MYVGIINCKPAIFLPCAEVDCFNVDCCEKSMDGYLATRLSVAPHSPAYLLKEYKEDEFIRCFMQKNAAISFVPPNFVRVSWDGLKVARQSIGGG